MPPLTSVTKDADQLTLTVVGDYPVSQQRLWDAFADPRQLERFWGPPDAPATFTRHDFVVDGRAEYYLSGPNGERWSGSWRFTAVDPVTSFSAVDGDDAEDDTGPSSMAVTFETTATGSRVTIVSRFASLAAMEANLPGMEIGMRAAVPQLDVVLATNTREFSVRAVKIVTHMSLDGVVQHSDDGDGFPYPAWSNPYRSPEGLEVLLSQYGDSFDLLFGRRTYDALGTFWPTAPSSPMADRINAGTKYVVTHRPDDLDWGPAEAIGPDLVADVRRIKEQDGPNIIVTGSTTLTSTLIEEALADQLVLIVDPVLLGTGKRLFAEKTPARSLELVDTKALPTGLVVITYEKPGPLKS